MFKLINNELRNITREIDQIKEQIELYVVLDRSVSDIAKLLNSVPTLIGWLSTNRISMSNYSPN